MARICRLPRHPASNCRTVPGWRGAGPARVARLRRRQAGTNVGCPTLVGGPTPDREPAALVSLLEGLRNDLAGRYDVERELATGGMGVLFVARDKVLDRTVVIKVSRPELSHSDSAQRFLREARILARFRHPNIVQVYDAGHASGLFYYVMDYVQGETLAERLGRSPPLRLEDVVQLGVDLLNALEAVHRLGITHRDVKPSNVFLQDDRALLGDFGVAKISPEVDSALTFPGQRVGTPAYMAPEQGVGGEVTPRTDLYAVGMVLYEAVTGRHWPGNTHPSRSDWHLIPEPLAAVLRRALAWSPEDRWPDAGSFRSALAASRAPLAAAAAAADTVPSNPRRLEAFPPVSVSRPEIRPMLAVGTLCVLVGLLGIRVGVDLAERFAWPTVVQWGFYSALVLSLLLAATFSLAGWVGAARVPSRFAWLASVPPNHLLGGLASVLVALILVASAVRLPPRSADPALDARRIAVLYFDDHTEGEDLRHMAAGFTEALIRELSGVQSLRVLSRNAVKRYRETELPVDSIARRLAAGSLVEGSIARSGDSIRVTVNLIDGQTGLALEGRALSRPLGELFSLQDDVADEVGGFLRRRLGVEIRRREQLRETKSVAAWDLVQRAERSMDDYRPLMVGGDTAAATRVLDAADSLLAEAESRDRNWIVPPVRRGWVAQLKARLLSPIPDRYEERLAGVAMGHAERALKLKPTDPDALELRGTLRYRLAAGVADSVKRGELFAAAEHDLRAAVNRNASQAGAWATLSELLQLIKADYVEAKQAAVRAYEADAFLDNADEILFSLAQISIDRGEYRDALRWSQEGRRRFPDMVNWAAVDLMVLVADRSAAADVGRAWKRVDEIREMLPPQRRAFYLPIAEMQVAAVLARAGLADSARAVITQSRASFPEEPETLGYEEAYAWLMLGDRDRALKALSDYLEVTPHRRSYVAKDRLFDELREDPRFQALVARGS